MIDRYARQEMAHIFSLENKYAVWQEIEVLACEAQAELGQCGITKEDAAYIREHAAFDRAEVDAIEGYVEQALYYSRGTSLDRDFQVREVKLADVVHDALRRKARTLIGARVVPELGGLDFTVRADPKWLSFVIGQVLVNSAKYRRPGEGEGHVRVFAERRETGLDAWETVLSIEDDGVGIPASDVGRVFDKGFTGENGRRFARSTGMGLYLVRQLCEKMGLTAWASSEEGAGTTVCLGFPDMDR